MKKPHPLDYILVLSFVFIILSTYILSIHLVKIFEEAGAIIEQEGLKGVLSEVWNGTNHTCVTFGEPVVGDFEEAK